MSKRSIVHLFERPEGGEKAVLVHLKFPHRHYERDQQEFEELCAASGAEVIKTITGARQAPDAKYYIGSGKAQEVHEAIDQSDAKLAIFNHDLTPAQERNLERLLQCRVLDRTGLILDIFAQRARTFEGKLQVELAQLQHLSTRLVRGWTHLERQKGGIGLRGPGETQLEVDRRLISGRIKSIKKRLEKVRAQREQSRRARHRAGLPTVSLVGYTNAGKSTLFNQLTESEIFVADMLFATLDPTLRRVHVPIVGQVIIADTVGFIRDLPHDLVEAFRATLEETQLADLILHVIDVADPDRQEQIDAVNDVLQEIGADKVPMLQIYNKIDLVKGEKPHVDVNDKGEPTRVWMSALSGKGLKELQEALTHRLSSRVIEDRIHLNADQGKLRAQLYELGAILAEHPDPEGGYWLEIRMQRDDYNRLLR